METIEIKIQNGEIIAPQKFYELFPNAHIELNGSYVQISGLFRFNSSCELSFFLQSQGVIVVPAQSQLHSGWLCIDGIVYGPFGEGVDFDEIRAFVEESGCRGIAVLDGTDIHQVWQSYKDSSLEFIAASPYGRVSLDDAVDGFRRCDNGFPCGMHPFLDVIYKKDRRAFCYNADTLSYYDFTGFGADGVYSLFSDSLDAINLEGEFAKVYICSDSGCVGVPPQALDILEVRGCDIKGEYPNYTIRAVNQELQSVGFDALEQRELIGRYIALGATFSNQSFLVSPRKISIFKPLDCQAHMEALPQEVAQGVQEVEAYNLETLLCMRSYCSQAKKFISLEATLDDAVLSARGLDGLRAFLADAEVIKFLGSDGFEYLRFEDGLLRCYGVLEEWMYSGLALLRERVERFIILLGNREIMVSKEDGGATVLEDSLASDRLSKIVEALGISYLDVCALDPQALAKYKPFVIALCKEQIMQINPFEFTLAFVDGIPVGKSLIKAIYRATGQAIFNGNGMGGFDANLAQAYRDLGGDEVLGLDEALCVDSRYIAIYENQNQKKAISTDTPYRARCCYFNDIGVCSLSALYEKLPDGSVTDVSLEVDSALVERIESALPSEYRWLAFELARVCEEVPKRLYVQAVPVAQESDMGYRFEYILDEEHFDIGQKRVYATVLQVDIDGDSVEIEEYDIPPGGEYERFRYEEGIYTIDGLQMIDEFFEKKIESGDAAIAQIAPIDREPPLYIKSDGSWHRSANTPIGEGESAPFVLYKPIVRDDGSVEVSYVAYDGYGNDITDEFFTLTVDECFLHKEL